MRGTPMWLATSPEVDGITGRDFVEREQVAAASHSTGIARCDRLWDESARLVGLTRCCECHQFSTPPGN
jgi:hypothetical protein